MDGMPMGGWKREGYETPNPPLIARPSSLPVGERPSGLEPLSRECACGNRSDAGAEYCGNENCRRPLTAEPLPAARPAAVDYDPNDAADRKYYDAAGIKVIDVIYAFNLNFALGSVVKYICRNGRKTADGLKDLEKAHWYLGREIERRKREAGE